MNEQNENGLEIKEEIVTYCKLHGRIPLLRMGKEIVCGNCGLSSGNIVRENKKWVSVESLLKHKVRWRSDHKDRPVECVILLSESQVNELEDLKDEED